MHDRIQEACLVIDNEKKRQKNYELYRDLTHSSPGGANWFSNLRKDAPMAVNPRK